MDEYKLIVCSNCKTPRIVEGNPQTVECFNCGKKLKMRKMEIKYSSNNRQEITEAKVLINSELNGNRKKEEIEQLLEKLRNMKINTTRNSSYKHNKRTLNKKEIRQTILEEYNGLVNENEMIKDINATNKSIKEVLDRMEQNSEIIRKNNEKIKVL